MNCPELVEKFNKQLGNMMEAKPNGTMENIIGAAKIGNEVNVSNNEYKT